jgi:hypothetical protein
MISHNGSEVGGSDGDAVGDLEGTDVGNAVIK